MNENRSETTALLDAVTKANNELANMGASQDIAIIILPAFTRDPSADPDDKIGVVMFRDKELHAALGVDANSAAEAAVDWVVIERWYRDGAPSVTPLCLPARWYQSAIKPG